MCPCPQQFELNAYHDDRLPTADRIAMEGHVRQCGLCSSELRSIQNLSRVLRAGARPAMPPEMRRRLYAAARDAKVPGVIRLVKMLTAAAAAILLAASLGLVQMRKASPPVAAAPAPWEQVAVSGDISADALAEAGTDRTDLQFADWVADDLSPRGRGGQN